jgi:hypothetical protein
MLRLLNVLGETPTLLPLLNVLDLDQQTQTSSLFHCLRVVLSRLPSAKLHPRATIGMGYPVLLPCQRVTRHFPGERRPQPAISNQIGPDFRPGQSFRHVLAEPVLTGLDLAEIVHPKCVQDGLARANFLNQSPQDALWIYSNERLAFVKYRSRAYPLSSLRLVTLCLKTSSGPCQSHSQSRKHWLRKFLRLGGPWTNGLKWHQWCKKLDTRTMMWKTCRLRRLHQGKGQHQMTSLIHLPQVEGRLVIDNDSIRFSQNMTPAWLQPVASMFVLPDTSPKYGTFAQAKGFFSWRTARA